MKELSKSLEVRLGICYFLLIDESNQMPILYKFIFYSYLIVFSTSFYPWVKVLDSTPTPSPKTTHTLTFYPCAIVAKSVN